MPDDKPGLIAQVGGRSTQTIAEAARRSREANVPAATVRRLTLCLGFRNAALVLRGLAETDMARVKSVTFTPENGEPETIVFVPSLELRPEA